MYTANEHYKAGKTAKEFFKDTTILADDVIYPLHADFVHEMIESYQPLESAFEFGCGLGKNLALLKQFHAHRKVKKVMGIDISEQAVQTAYKLGRGQTEDFTILNGDEWLLAAIDNKTYDVCFTCSVLDHIPTEEQTIWIVDHLKRICKKGVLLAETLADKPDWYYYPHNYEAMGFIRQPPNYAWVSPVDGNTYHIWKFFK